MIATESGRSFLTIYLLTPTPNSTGTFQGCFRHSWSKVELANVPVIDYEHASRESCRGHCSAAGFLYYALEFGFMCSCGSRLPRESNLATMADCSLVRWERRTTHHVLAICPPRKKQVDLTYIPFHVAFRLVGYMNPISS